MPKGSAPSTRRPGGKPWPIELDLLENYRCQRDLTFRALAARMAQAGFPVHFRTLHPALAQGRVPLQRTLYRIRRFLDNEWAGGRLRVPARGRGPRFPLCPTPETVAPRSGAEAR